MSSFFSEVRETLLPRSDSKDGPLPPMLVAMTLVTGLVDSFSYLVLGHVFVANMTGNVVFLAFALAGAQGFSVISSLIALGSFIVGSLVGGLVGSRTSGHRGHLLRISTALQVFFLGVSAVLSALSQNPIQLVYSYCLIIALGITMGIQNASARKLPVPDLTTTVLTLTIVGIAADSHVVGGSGSRLGRRLISVFTMFIGALIGSLMILYVSIVYPIVIALIITMIVAVMARTLSRGNPAWVRTK